MASPPSPSSPPHPAKKAKMSSSSPAASDEDDHPSPSSTPAGDAPRRRYKRRKVAIFLGYCGFGYQGMQKNPGARTIEGDLEEALFLAGAVPAPDRGLPRRYDWARAARTDKGVSAAAQVVSGRFYVDPPGFVARLNDHLHPQIRAFGYKRVTNSFNAKKFCDRRRYVYLLPVFALDPSAHPDREAVAASLGSGSELARCLECSERGRKVPGLMGRQSRDADEEERTHLGSEEVGKEGKGDPNSNSETGVLAVEGGNEGGSGGFEPNVSNEVERSELGCSNLNSETGVFITEGRNEVGSGEFESKQVESSDHSNHGVSGAENGASDMDLDTGGLIGAGRTEVRNGAGASEGSAGVSKPESVSECGTSKANDDSATEEKSVMETQTSVEMQMMEPEAVGGANGEQPAVRGTGFCYGDEVRKRFNRILQRYVGTHNFHNFTTRTKAEDPSARRYIISFDATRVVSIGGIDFIRCEVIGQSFMLHQIRKMIGLAVALMRNCAPESLMDVALRKDIRINVPTAPEVGLYLDECLFTSYNKKWKDSHEELTMEAYAEEAEEFKMKYILSHIADMEHKEGAVSLWLHSLNRRNYPDFQYMETNGGCANTGQTQVENLGERSAD